MADDLGIVTTGDLDPADWHGLRRLGHRMLDDLFDHLAGLRERPVWQALPDPARAELRAPLADEPVGAEAAYADFRRLVMPYTAGNLHPGFMGWVHGGGSPVGMLAELLAGGLNANLGGRDHAPIEVERQVIAWAARQFGLPESAGGLFVTGSSAANFIAVLAARTAALGPSVRTDGLRDAKLVGYASAAAHSCLPRALDMAGLGSDALRLLPIDAAGRMDLPALRAAIAADRAAGLRPFMVAATAGSVDTGAIDDLAAIAEICRAEQIWFHVDGAFGAFAALSPLLASKVAGLEQADSLAFDFHKLGQAPYDSGCILVREQAHLLASFSQQAAYLRAETRGLAGNAPWPVDLGPDLSRGFKALKVWMMIKSYGTARLAAVVEQCCAVAQGLAGRIDAEPALQRLAPVALNIVCFRPRGADDATVRGIAADVQIGGAAVLSTTSLDGQIVLRAAITNHRTRAEDADRLVDAVLAAITPGLAQLPG